MAKNIALENIQTFNAPNVDTGSEYIVRGVQSAVSDIESGVKQLLKNDKNRLMSEVERIRENDELQAKKIAAEEKRAKEEQEARDEIRAEDELGKVQRNYLRAVQDLDKNWLGDKTSQEYENEKKAIFDELLSNVEGIVSPDVSKKMKKSGKDWINAKLYADLTQAYKDELKAAEDSFNNIVQDSQNNAFIAGQMEDIPAGAANFAMKYETLKNYADKTAKDDGVLKQFSKDYMKSFISGVAENNPEMAEKLITPEALAWFTQGNYEKDKDYYDKLSSDLSNDLSKAIQFGKNKKQIEDTQKEYDDITNATIGYMNNVISQTPDELIAKIREDKPFKKQLSDALYVAHQNSDKVGKGEINPNVLAGAISSVSDITIDKNGNPEDNLYKFVMTHNALVASGASPEQISIYRQFAEKALTDDNFKRQIANMANKPSFDTLFNNTTGSSKPKYQEPISILKSMAGTRQEDMNKYVEQMGREALLGFMDRMTAGKVDEAYDFYDKVFQEAYDYVKSDIIDVNYVKKNLEKLGYAMVDLNGQMTKIIGRGQNGEYIIESTGGKINGGY